MRALTVKVGGFLHCIDACCIDACCIDACCIDACCIDACYIEAYCITKQIPGVWPIVLITKPFLLPRRGIRGIIDSISMTLMTVQPLVPFILSALPLHDWVVPNEITRAASKTV